MKFTRADYMANKCSHQEYYIQFSNPSRVNIVINSIGCDEILNSKDESFNDIPLVLWDRLPELVNARELNELGEINSFSTKVCVAKSIARTIRGW